MATRCEVCGQYPIQGTIRTFFPWPADISQRAYWQTCLGIQDLDLSKPELFICSDHFDQLQMIRKGSTLRKDAFPKRYEGPLPTFPQGGEVPPEPPKMEPSLETPCPDVKNEDGIFGTSGPPAPLFDDEEIMPEELSMAKLLLLFTAAAKERPSGITPLVTPVAEETKAFSNILIDRQQKYLDSYCKSCLRQAELVNMMEANCEGVPVLLMYKSVFMTELDLSEIPQLMCHTCIGLLFQCFKFTTMTLRSCEVLRAARERFKYLPPLDDSDIDLKNIPEKYSATPAPIAAVIESDEDDKQEVKKVVRKRKATMKVKLSAPPKKKGRPARRASVKSKKVNKKILDSDVSSSESENFDNDEADPDFEDAAAIKDESPESSDVEPELEEKEEPEDEGDEEKVEEDENYCMLCRHKFSNMARHMDKVHRVDWENKSCERCEESFETLKEFFHHISSEHDQNKCSICQIEFEDSKDLKRHVKLSGCGKQLRREEKKRGKGKKLPRVPTIKEETDELICKLCTYSTESFKEMFDHIKANHEDVLECILCDKSYDDKYKMLAHYKVHGKNVYCWEHFIAFETTEKFLAHYNAPGHDLECGICGKICRSRGHKYSHKKSHKTKYTSGHYECPECSLVYGCTSNLRRHILAFHRKRTFLCEDCGKSFTSTFMMKKHMAGKHNKGDDRISFTMSVQCETCGKKLNSLPTYKRHKAKHLGHTDFCGNCNDSFESKEALQQHVELTGHTWLDCPQCPYGFKTKTLLAKHLTKCKKPNTEPPKPKRRGKPPTKLGVYYHKLPNGYYGCNLCSKQFTLYSNARRHTNIHMGKTFPCEKCGKKFAQKSGLQAHLLTHSDERPYKCTICGAAFKDHSTAYKHKKRHGHPMETPASRKRGNFSGGSRTSTEPKSNQSKQIAQKNQPSPSSDIEEDNEQHQNVLNYAVENRYEQFEPSYYNPERYGNLYLYDARTAESKKKLSLPVILK